MGWAQHACVPICDVETAGIAWVPVGVLLHQIGIRRHRGLFLPTTSWADESLPSCWWRCKGIACGAAITGRECHSTNKWRWGAASSIALSASASTASASKTQSVGWYSALPQDRGINRSGGCMSPSSAAAVSLPLSHVACIER
jgi:hypothetical protein